MRGARRAGPRRERQEKRRGATIVLVAVCMVMLIGMVGVGVDFARMYAFKTQLKTVTDASAMAGAIEMQKGNIDGDQPQQFALIQAPLNYIEGGNLATVLPAGVEGVEWDFTTRQVVGPGYGDDYDNPKVNAIRVAGTYTANFTFARVFGLPTATLFDTTVAALGSLGSSKCMKPWAVPYENILWTLGKPDPRDTSYVLTNDDVADLRDNQKKIAFKVTSSSDSLVWDEFGNPIPGNYFPVRYPAYRDPAGNEYPNQPKPDPGGDQYRNKIKDACLAGTINVGDYLQVEQGVKKGPTSQGVQELCKYAGSAKSFACDVEIELPIWAGTYKLGGPKNVRVKYVGAFHLTNYDDGLVSGYLTSMQASGGGFVGAAGPVRKGAIVY